MREWDIGEHEYEWQNERPAHRLIVPKETMDVIVEKYFTNGRLDFNKIVPIPQKYVLGLRADAIDFDPEASYLISIFFSDHKWVERFDSDKLTTFGEAFHLTRDAIDCARGVDSPRIAERKKLFTPTAQEKEAGIFSLEDYGNALLRRMKEEGVTGDYPSEPSPIVAAAREWTREHWDGPDDLYDKRESTLNAWEMWQLNIGGTFTDEEGEILFDVLDEEFSCFRSEWELSSYDDKKSEWRRKSFRVYAELDEYGDKKEYRYFEGNCSAPLGVYLALSKLFPNDTFEVDVATYFTASWILARQLFLKNGVVIRRRENRDRSFNYRFGPIDRWYDEPARVYWGETKEKNEKEYGDKLLACDRDGDVAGFVDLLKQLLSDIDFDLFPLFIETCSPKELAKLVADPYSDERNIVLYYQTFAQVIKDKYASFRRCKGIAGHYLSKMQNIFINYAEYWKKGDEEKEYWKHVEENYAFDSWYDTPDVISYVNSYWRLLALNIGDELKKYRGKDDKKYQETLALSDRIKTILDEEIIPYENNKEFYAPFRKELETIIARAKEGEEK